MNFFKILSCLVLVTILTVHAYGQDTVYIDPLCKQKFQDGSIQSPYRSWNNIKQAAHKVYLQKRNTVDTIDHLFFASSNMTLGAYGIGKKPVIYCRTQEEKHAFIAWNKTNIKITNLEIVAPQALSCIYLNFGNQNCLIDSCILHESKWGIRITSGKNVGHTISQTEVYHILEDGIFVQDAKEIEIFGCHIHDVNLNWKPPSTPESLASGDGIQFSRCTEWYVHHNTIDRSNSGNKFCFISNNPKQRHCIFEYNTLISPLKNGSCIYLGSGSHLIIRYNWFYGTRESTGIFHHTDSLEVYYNIFTHFKNGILSYNDTPCKVFNNVFYSINYSIKGKNILSFNNIFDNQSLLQVPYTDVRKLIEKNNHYTTGYNSPSSTSGNPMFHSPDDFDFHLEPKSPCIDSGIPHHIATDLGGSHMPTKGKVDKGVYENNQAAEPGF